MNCDAEDIRRLPLHLDELEREGWPAAEGLLAQRDWLRGFIARAATPPPRCATCRWAEEGWDEYSPTRDEDPPLVARYPLACARAAMSDGKPEHPEALAFTMDGSGYRGELMVSPDFGCVMWEAKP